MAIADPEILPFNAPCPGTQTTEWFEICLDEFRVQKQLPCYHDATLHRWWVDAKVWDEWRSELVEYFIHNGYKGREIEAFIKDHALGGSGKVSRT